MWYCLFRIHFLGATDCCRPFGSHSPYMPCSYNTRSCERCNSSAHTGLMGGDDIDNISTYPPPPSRTHNIFGHIGPLKISRHLYFHQVVARSHEEAATSHTPHTSTTIDIWRHFCWKRATAVCNAVASTPSHPLTTPTQHTQTLSRRTDITDSTKLRTPNLPRHRVVD